MDTERVWTHLNQAQADGRDCVICTLPTGSQGAGSVPVGRSPTGSQVFACARTCAAQAEHVAIDPEP